jgi:hypothetical protein
MSEETVQFSVRLPVAHLSALERLAEEEDRTVSAQIRRLVRRFVEAGDDEKAAA